MIGQYPPLGRPTGRNRWIIRKPQPRTGTCDGCRAVKNRLAIYVSWAGSRRCRDCILTPARHERIAA
jgi:hypothetical protein